MTQSETSEYKAAVSKRLLQLEIARERNFQRELIKDGQINGEDASEWIWRAGMRTFDSGATRDDDEEKYDYEGFLSPLVLERYAKFMHKNRIQSDGETRSSDNWQKGISLSCYMKSLVRHVIELWLAHRSTKPGLKEDIACAIMFNVMGYLHELLKNHISTPAEERDLHLKGDS